jgi:LPS-assembly lipoprotein
MMQKKQYVQVFNLIFLSLLLTACGFHLRQPADLPAEYQSVYVDGQGSFGSKLSELLGYSSATVVKTRSDADVIIHIISDKKETRTLSLSRGGKSTEQELTRVILYELLDAESVVLLPEQKLEMVRNYYNDQTGVIGKSNEEALIYQEMDRQMAGRLLRQVRVVLEAK